MTIGSRRFLYLSFIFVFIVAGSALLFFLQGYRFNTDKGKIERTGAIQADSLPEGAVVVLNEQPLDRITPATILSLRPNDYQLELKLDGFQPWHKNLTVSPAAVTFSGPVRLWPNSTIGTALKVGHVTASYLSPNGENLLYLTQPSGGTELWLLNLTSGQDRLLQRTAATEITNVEWAITSREVLLQERENNTIDWHIFSLETNSWESLPLPTELQVNAVHWGDERHLLYATTAGELYELNRRTQSTKLVWRERLQDYRVHDGLVFGLARGTGEAIDLKVLNLANLQLVPLPNSPTLSTTVFFMPANEEWLPLFDYDRHALYLLHSPLTATEPVRRIPEVTATHWVNEHELVITNNFEIWLYELTEQAPKFVERLSSPLSGAQRYAEEPYLLFVSGGEIWALELDERDARQRWLLAKYDQDVQAMFLSPTGETLIVQTANDLYRVDLTVAPPAAEPPASSPAATIQKYLHLSNRPSGG
ncbi:MAG: PEGA domain-containing protein [Candidatus Veblenbacteria bacterium]|nr:PEGA domain-containing protein [Candidatus Veblenbacteria bacterium]MDZ4229516.1 PEGA domain-containing protein [Candidatus Veblenbacteria bacterium]